MADLVRKIAYFKATAPNKPGEGAKALNALKDEGVNLLAFTGFPRAGRAQLDFIPEDAAAFKRAAKKAGLRLSAQKTGFLIQGDDRPGAVAGITARLAMAGVNIIAMDAVAAGGGRYGAILWVKPADVAKTTKALGAVK